MKTQILTTALCAGILGLSACGGEPENGAPGYDTVDPSAAEPTATTAPPAEMQPETIGMDTMGRGMSMDTMSR